MDFSTFGYDYSKSFKTNVKEKLWDYREWVQIAFWSLLDGLFLYILLQSGFGILSAAIIAALTTFALYAACVIVYDFLK